MDPEMEEITRQMKQAIESAVIMAEQMAEGDLGDRLAKATALLSRKIYDAFRDSGFSASESINLTCAALAKGK